MADQIFTVKEIGSAKKFQAVKYGGSETIHVYKKHPVFTTPIPYTYNEFEKQFEICSYVKVVDMEDLIESELLRNT